MTARLPIVGGDDSDWGTILNLYLQVSHDAGGNLLPAAVSAALPSPISTTNLGSGTGSSSNFLRGDGMWAVPNGSAVTNVFGRTGAIAAQSGDYTAAEVGALPATDDLSVIAAVNATAGNVSLNSHKITNLTNGASSQDAAAFGQIPTSASSIGGLIVDNNLSDLQSASLARTNLGLGSAATQSTAAFDTAGAAAAAQSVAEAASVPIAGGTMDGWLAPAVTELTFGTNITINASGGNVFTLTLTASTGTLANPTNQINGQHILVCVTQGTGGNFTLSYDSAYNFGVNGQPSLSTNAGDVDVLGFIYLAALSQWLCVGAALGF